MKTMKFRLLATIITLAAVITTTNTRAQRRSNDRESSRETTEREHIRKSAELIERSKVRENAYERNASGNRSGRISEREVKRNTDVEMNSRERSSGTSSESARNNDMRSRNGGKPETLKGSINFEEYSKGMKSTSSRNRQSDNSTYRDSQRPVEENSVRSRNTDYARNNSTDKSKSNIRRTGSSNFENNRNKYHLDENDSRYKANHSYKGNQAYWTSSNRNTVQNNVYINNSHLNYYWDRSWENYCWNKNSWVNYYSYYNPYSYRHHKHYYHHHYYGHVIRTFVSPPAVYVYNHHNYYCYDGHFFNFHPGIGYVLVDVPYGLTFQYIPDNYELVHINGFLYFRVGNLFFDYIPGGFRLVHYPERYYAWDADYCNGGLSFEAHIF